MGLKNTYEDIYEEIAQEPYYIEPVASASIKQNKILLSGEKFSDKLKSKRKLILIFTISLITLAILASVGSYFLCK